MKPPKHPSEIGLREVLLEFHQVGKHLKVTAIDPDTGTEVSMVADPKVGRESLKRMATQKLVYVMDKKGLRGKGPGGRRNRGGFDELA
jgi:hypothetical protein